MPKSPRTKREYLRELVADKNRWSRPLTDEEKALGFLGWHERGYLPHCDFSGLVQFVTFRLSDSMPATRRGEWEHLLVIGDLREKRTKFEEYLDRGLGECHLHDSRIAKLCEDALLFFHQQRYELIAWCVMPNHIHVLVHVWQWPLWKMIASWKKFAARKAGGTLPSERRFPNRRVVASEINAPNWSSALRGAFWEREYWDTFMRDEEQERKAIGYIESNPVKAKMCAAPQEWPFSSARFCDEYRRMVLPEKCGAPISKSAR